MEAQAEMAWFRVALALLLAFTVTTTTAEVVPLTDATFAETLDSGSVWFIDFYVDWCPWSKRLAPAWEQLGHDEELRQAEVKVGTVDCDNSKATCMKAKVQGYPSMKIFYKGEFLDEYMGTRDSNCMKEFALGFQVGRKATVDAAIPRVVTNSTDLELEELKEELLHDPRISVGMLPRMLLKFFGF